MREYYVKQIFVMDKPFSYVRGNNLSANVHVTLGDFNDFQFETIFIISDLINFAKGCKIYGYRYGLSVYGDHILYELVKYTSEFRMLEDYIEGYDVIDINKPVDVKGVRVTDECFKHRWFSVNKPTVGYKEKPVSIADYIINYANGNNFSSDLRYVYCSTESKVVRFILSSECRTLLSKLRLLR